MKHIVKIGYIMFSILFLVYLSLPSPKYPVMFSNSIQSFEPADVEDNFRRGYYTDLKRDEALNHYFNNFGNKLLNYRLNYPPEEAFTLIRDQTRSTFLEEIVHPFRESIFVNGFEPKLDKDKIIIDNKIWRQKIIVKYIPSNLQIRLTVGILILILGVFIYNKLVFSIKDIKKVLRND